MMVYKEIEAAKSFWNNAYEGAKGEVLSEEDYALPENMKALFEEFLNSSETVVDYGCGAGDLLLRGAHLGLLQHGIGIEQGANIVHYATELAQMNGYEKQITYYDGGLDAVRKMESESVDGIIVSNVFDIMQKETADEVFKELTRILKKHGHLFLKLNSFGTDEENKKLHLENFSENLFSKNGVFRVRNCTTEEWRQWFAPYYAEKAYMDVAYQAPEFFDRLFLLEKRGE